MLKNRIIVMQWDGKTHNDRSLMVVPLTRPPFLSCLTMETEEQGDEMGGNHRAKSGS